MKSAKAIIALAAYMIVGLTAQIILIAGTVVVLDKAWDICQRIYNRLSGPAIRTWQSITRRHKRASAFRSKHVPRNVQASFQ